MPSSPLVTLAGGRAYPSEQRVDVYTQPARPQLPRRHSELGQAVAGGARTCQLPHIGIYQEALP